MDDGMDYDVQTTVNFRLDFDGSGEFNILLLPDIQKQFVQHVKEVFERDDTLGKSYYVTSDLNFHFDGRMVQLEYTFSCHDENEAEAESFSAYCVRDVQEALEGFGCKIRKIDCKAEEADTSWLDQLEDAIFGPKDSVQKQTTAEDKSDQKTITKKKAPRQER